jgi:hypothetical protein
MAGIGTIERPLGRQGFKSAEEAREDAQRHLYGIEYAILRRTMPDVLSQEGDFAWVTPIAYADRLVARGVAEKVQAG